MLTPIVCKNDVNTIIKKLQEYINNGCIIKGIYLVDSTDDQIIVLLSDSEITEEQSKIWWSGYLLGMQKALGS